ncbi:MAG: hypothetical protein WCS73_03265 [Lentisphaeria bacterium]
MKTRLVKYQIIICIIALTLWTGCQTVSKSTPLEEAKKTEAENKDINNHAMDGKRPLPFNKIKAHTADFMDETPIQTEEAEESETVQIKRDLDLPDRKNVQTASELKKAEYPDNLIKGMANPDEKLENLALIFDAATVDEVVAAFAAELNFNYLVDPAVKGAITMTLKSNELTAREVWSTFEHLLWLSGAYASKNPGFIHILPFEKMPKERRIYAQHEIQPNVIVDFVTIKYKKSADVINIIKPFMTEGASATDIVDSNTIIIVEAPANIHKIKEIISRVDLKGERAWPVECFPCQQVDAQIIVEELQQLLPIIGLPIATGTGASGGAIKITGIQRLGVIIVSAALPEVVAEIGKWIKAFDRSDMMDKEEIYFYNARHTTVERLSASLDAFFNTVTSASPTTTSTSSTEGTSSKSSSLSATTASKNKTSSSKTTSSKSNKSSTSDDDDLNKTIFDTEVIVYSDDESNRLTIKTTPRTWHLIKIFLERQDITPRQVSIQAIITDIDLSENNEFGISYAISNLIKSGDTTLGTVVNTAATDSLMSSLLGTDAAAVTSALGSWDTGIGAILSHNNDPLAVIKAVAGDGNTSVLSEPHVIVCSGSEAYLQAGSKVSIPTESTSYTSSSDGNMSTNYEYQDTGVIMTVTPYITAGHEVRLQMEQEFSVPVKSSLNTSTYDINTKKITSELIVPDNTTIMLGGMIQTTDIITHSGIPFLKDIPYFGVFFRSNSVTKKRSELLILLTVNVIDSQNPQEELVRKYKKSLEQIAKKHNKDGLY